jgi:uncharacterized protein (DUF1778 family)
MFILMQRGGFLFCRPHGLPNKKHFKKIRLGMARPNKDFEEKKIHLTYVRLTSAERALLSEAAKLEDYNLSDYIRSKVFSSYYSHVRKDPVKRKLLLELNKIGVNINQIAKALNSGKNPELRLIKESLSELHFLIKELFIKLIGR